MLRRRFRGALLRPGEEGYEEGRRVWNGAIDRRPRLIARCAGADDVQAVLALRARARPPGHRPRRRPLRRSAMRSSDGGVMIDLSLMKAVSVDPQARVARAAGGLTWSELDLATQRHGLATTGGTISSVGIGGLTLGGGLGHLMRRHGMTVDNVRAVELVTADAERLRVDADSDPELFWGLRGGGGNFGIATAFEYDLHPVGPIVLGGPVYWPLEQAPEVLGFLGELRARRTRRARHHARGPPRAAAAVPAARALRHARARPAADLVRRRRRGPARDGAAALRSARRSPTPSVPSPIAPCSR